MWISPNTGSERLTKRCYDIGYDQLLKDSKTLADDIIPASIIVYPYQSDEFKDSLDVDCEVSPEDCPGIESPVITVGCNNENDVKDKSTLDIYIWSDTRE